MNTRKSKLGSAYRSGYCDGAGALEYYSNPFSFWKTPFLWFSYCEGFRNGWKDKRDRMRIL